MIVSFDPRDLGDAYDELFGRLFEGNPHAARAREALVTEQWRMACASYQWRRRAERDEEFMRVFDRGWWDIRQAWRGLDYARYLAGEREPGTALALRTECRVCRRP